MNDEALEIVPAVILQSFQSFLSRIFERMKIGNES